MTDFTRIAALPGSRASLGSHDNRLEPLLPTMDRASAVARALRKMEAAFERRQLVDRARAVADKAATALLDASTVDVHYIDQGKYDKVSIATREVIENADGTRTFSIEINRIEPGMLTADQARRLEGGTLYQLRPPGRQIAKRATGESSALWPSMAAPMEKDLGISAGCPCQACAEIRRRYLAGDWPWSLD